MGVGDEDEFDGEIDDSETQDERMQWLQSRVQLSLGANAESFRKCLEQDAVRDTLLSFLDGKSRRVVFSYDNSDKDSQLLVSAEFPQIQLLTAGAKLLVALKLIEGGVAVSGINDEVTFTEMAGDSIEQMIHMLEDVYYPLILHGTEAKYNKVPREFLFETQEVLSIASVAYGMVHSRTRFALPVALSGETRSVELLAQDKEIVRHLESAAVGWIRQIKVALAPEPEDVFRTLAQPPQVTPLNEITFWRHRADDLLGLANQLDLPQVTSAIEVLEHCGSTFWTPIVHMVQRVEEACEEATDIAKVLTPLESQISRLLDTGLDIDDDAMDQLLAAIKPFFHTLFLIWKTSAFYCSEKRLAVVIRLLSYMYIKQCSVFLNMTDILAEEKQETSIARFDKVLSITQKFRDVFESYMLRSDAEARSCERQPWSSTLRIAIAPIETFEERCNVICQSVQAWAMYLSMQDIELTGVDGRSLTTSLQQIVFDIDTAVRHTLATPGLLFLEEAEFSSLYFSFRELVGELDRRVSSVLIRAISNTVSLMEIFKIFVTFGPMVNRLTVRQAIKQKHFDLLQAFRSELSEVNELFNKHKADGGVASANMPPTSAAVCWARSLVQRIQQPFQAFSDADPDIFLSEEGANCKALYMNLMRALEEFEVDSLSTFSKDIDTTAASKLKLSLLSQEAENALAVNFDPAIVRLLREVKYFLQLKLEVPESASAIYDKSETLRTQTGNLQLIVNMTNKVHATLLDVERPLIQAKLSELDEILSKGLTGLTWRSHGVAEFIQQSMVAAKEVWETLSTTKNNLNEIDRILASWKEQLLFSRTEQKTYSLDEFKTLHGSLVESRVGDFSKGASQIQNLLQSNMALFGAARSSPSWKAYVAYVQNRVVGNIAKAIMSNIEYIGDQLDDDKLAHVEGAPLLDIKAELLPSGPSLAPCLPPQERMRLPEAEIVDVDGNEGNTICLVCDNDTMSLDDDPSLGGLLRGWMQHPAMLGALVARLDGSEGDLFMDALGQKDAQGSISRLWRLFQTSCGKAKSFLDSYNSLDFLWKQSAEEDFQEFVESHLGQAKGGSSSRPSTPTPTNAPQVSLDSSLPPLADLDAKLASFAKVKLSVQALPNMMLLGWLRVDAKPLKSALNTWVSKRKLTFTNAVTESASRQLQEMHSFMKDVNEGLLRPVQSSSPDFIEALHHTLHKIQDCKMRSSEIEKSFEPLRKAAGLLSKYEAPLDEGISKLLEEAPSQWSQLQKLTLQTKERLETPCEAEAQNIKRQASELVKQAKDMCLQLSTHSILQGVISTDESYRLLAGLHEDLLSLETGIKAINDQERLFELVVTDTLDFRNARTTLLDMKKVIDATDMIDLQFKRWKLESWTELDIELCVDECRKLQKEVKLLPKSSKSWNSTKSVEETVRMMMLALPLVQSLRSPSMRDRHWLQLMRVTGVSMRFEGKLPLSAMLDLQLHKHQEDVGSLVDAAQKELVIENNIKKLEAVWNSFALEFVTHPDTHVPLLQTPDAAIEAWEEHQVLLQSMLGSRFVAHFFDEVSEWQGKIATIESVVSTWIDLQRKWVRLQAIFVGSADIRVQLPEDTKRFDGVDEQFREMMQEAVESTAILDACFVPGRQDLLDDLTARLEKCEKALADYLETKRVIFPRFYFVSSADLLDILSKASASVHSVIKHLSKCFDNIQKLNFEQAASGQLSDTALSMVSKEGETVALADPFVCEGAVEIWLLNLVTAMRVSLKTMLTNAVGTSAWLSTASILDLCAQLSLCIVQIRWTMDIDLAFDRIENTAMEGAMQTPLQSVSQRLKEYTDKVAEDLTREMRTKIITLITVEVHSRDVTQNLVDSKVMSGSAFAWQSQLRYYYRDKECDCQVRIADASFEYGYEYIGNCGRLVITPLTDRCYMTLTQSLRLFMGGAPAGPAGTGKTETTKDLGRGLGMPVYVFNCSEQMDYMSMAQIFKGLSQSGAWGCFDEFNRIAIEVLSVVSTQVKSILDAVRVKANKFSMMGEEISLIPSIGIFITMNPGYAGRTELPENLKALFRPVAMIVPDFGAISEIMLYSEAFQMAKQLALKFVRLYSLNKELLSKQDHYDWGLRAIKSVLVVAGSLKRADPELAEPLVLFRALRDLNLPKIVVDDVPIFMGLIQDLFPKTDLPRKRNEELETAIATSAKAKGLQVDELFVLKCTQLQELLDVRHSVFVLGPGGCGKSKVLQTLIDAQTALGCPVHKKVLNPKAVSTNELYGYVHPATRDWRDGVFSIMMREMAEASQNAAIGQEGRWLILDGDIDPNWIESLNTVMDDNKVLTLASNERIPLTPTMRLLFEISSLKHATPATVSRAGILYINEGDIGWKPMVQSWLDKLDVHRKNEVELIWQLYDRHMPVLLQATRASFDTITPLRDLALVRTSIRMFEALYCQCAATQSLDAEKTLLESLFQYSAMWALGGCLAPIKNSDVLAQFSSAFKKTLGDSLPLHIPDDGVIFDYAFVPSSQAFVPWSTRVQAYNHIPFQPFYDYVVPTDNLTRLSELTAMFISKGFPVMAVGGAGTGKTVMLKQALGNIEDDGLMSVGLSLNYYTDAAAMQGLLESPLEKKAGRVFGPPGSRKLVYMVDDLNMPVVDTYDTQTAHALMRQHLDHGMWFDKAKMTVKEIRKCQYVASMNPLAGSFSVDDRLQHHFSVFATFVPTAAGLSSMYSPIVDGHFELWQDGQNSASSSIRSLVPKLVEVTVELHRKIADRFLPTAEKFFYQFSLRDLAAVFAGLLRASPSHMSTCNHVYMHWKHEICRVYEDRLLVQADIKAFRDMFNVLAKKVLMDLNANELADLETEELIFTHFEVHNDDGDGVYAHNRDYSKLAVLVNEKLADYNENNAAMDLVLFDAALLHVCRIARILSLPRGSPLLVGVGGSGKQSLTRLAAFICEHFIFQITVAGNYGLTEFKADVANVYSKAGSKGIPTTFILTDAQIVDDSFLVVINDILSSGEVADLFTKEDKDSLGSSVRLLVKESGLTDSNENCWNFFINQVRANLHICLCFSPVGDRFRTWARKFPALTSCTSIDVFHAWSQEALVSVAAKFLAEVELSQSSDVEQMSTKSSDEQTESNEKADANKDDLNESSEAANSVNGGLEKEDDEGDNDLHSELRRSLAQYVAAVHTTVSLASDKFKNENGRFYYTTPKSFLEMVASYLQILGKSRSELNAQIERLDNGLKKLLETEVIVQHLRKDLEEEQVHIEAKTEATNELLERVEAETAIVDEQQAIATEEEAKLSVLQGECEELAASCAKDLEEAEPAVIKAQEALQVLDKKSLTEMKSFTTPPKDVENVASAVLILLSPPTGKKDLSWGAAKKTMAQVDRFMQQLLNFDKENIHDAKLQALQPYLDDKNFNGPSLMAKSAAASGLCEWVINIVMYYRIYREVKPKRESLLAAQAKLEEANEGLNEMREKLRAIKEKADELMAQFKEAQAEKDRMIAAAEKTQKRLALAERLINGLAGEKIRWTDGLQDLKVRGNTAVGDSLVAAAFISYIGAFGMVQRSELQTSWMESLKSMKVPHLEGITAIQVLSDEAIQAQWRNEGLPSDSLSLQNACIVTNCSRWPLLIDPQLQGIGWVLQREKLRDESALKLVQLSDSKLMKYLEAALENGTTMVIEGVGEHLDATLDPVISRSLVRKGASTYIMLGEKEVPYDSNFQLYLQTRLNNPHYRPEICAQTTLVNFCVTSEGLEEQLLSVVVNAERPDLEEQRVELLRQQNEFQIKLKELEDSLLARLSAAEGDIISDIELIENLEVTKATAADIAEQSAIAQKTQAQISSARNSYRLVAVRGSLVFFLMNNLALLDHMYQFSLAMFSQLYTHAIVSAQASEDTNERINNIIENVTLRISEHVLQALFEKDKISYSTQLCFSIQLRSEAIQTSQVDFFTRGPKAFESRNPLPWAPDSVWQTVMALGKQFPHLDRLASDISESKRWKEWYEAEKPETEKLPGDWRSSSAMEKLLIIRAIRPDRVVPAVRLYVLEVLKQRIYVQSPPMDMDVLLKSAGPKTPVFFILSPGVDPTKAVEAAAQSAGAKFVNIALGQGQEKGAEKAVAAAAEDGGWVVLQNVHLVPRWLKALERVVESNSGKELHDGFQLFLTAEPSNAIPIGLLQRCIKVSNEPPQGLKANILRGLNLFRGDALEQCLKENEFKSIVFCLCYFHAVIVERRKFGKQGWNRVYPFNLGDLSVSAQVLRNYLDDQPHIPWDDLRYIFGEIMYGGHITDDWDRRLCNSYLLNYINPSALSGGDLFDGFKVPSPTEYEGYVEVVEQMPAENPSAFGMHANAEIEHRLQLSDHLFLNINRLGGGAAGGGVEGKTERIKSMIDDILEKLPTAIDMTDVQDKTSGDTGNPYTNVFLQECSYLNALQAEMLRSLKEADSALRGDVTLTEAIEILMGCLFDGTIPPSWAKLSWATCRSLGAWVQDFVARLSQVSNWAVNPSLPLSCWLSGMVNPQAFTTAVVQVTARKNDWPLDKVTIQTEVTKFANATDVSAPSTAGAYVHGMFLQGARWNEKVGGLDDPLPGQLVQQLPVVLLKAVQQGKEATRDIYVCPVYKTQDRGPTFVFTARLKTRTPAKRWVIGGTAVLLDPEKA